MVFLFFSWPSGCFSCFAGFVFGAVRFPGVSRFLFLGFPASCCVVLLHLASFSLRLGQEHSLVRPAAMDPGPPPAVHWRVPGFPSPAGSRPWNAPVRSWRGVRDSL